MGIAGLFIEAAALISPVQFRTFAELILIVAFAIIVGCLVRYTMAPLHVKFSWILYTILIVTLNRYSWSRDWDFLRVSSEWYVLGAIILIGSRVKVKPMIVGCIVLLWFFQAHRLMRHIL